MKRHAVTAAFLLAAAGATAVVPANASAAAGTTQSARKGSDIKVAGAEASQTATNIRPDVQQWGVYAQLAGTTWSGKPGTASWAWAPDNTIVETFGRMTTHIELGDQPGRLVQRYDSLHASDGTVAADGSVVWVRRSPGPKAPMRIAMANGHLNYDMVELDDMARVVKVARSYRMDHVAGSTTPYVVAQAGTGPAPAQNKALENVVPPSSTVATPGVAVGATATVAAPKPTPAQIAQWDVLNRRFNTALLNEKSPIRDGMWLDEEHGRAFSMRRAADGTITRKLVWVLRDGRQNQTSITLTFDRARGTWQEARDGKTPKEWRVASHEGGRYRAETPSDLGQPQAAPYWAEVAGDKFNIYTPADRLKVAYKWVPNAKAMASLKAFADWCIAEQRAEQEKLAQQKAESDRQLQADMAEMNAQLDREKAAWDQAERDDAEWDAEVAAKRDAYAAQQQERDREYADSAQRLQDTIDMERAVQAQGQRQLQQEAEQSGAAAVSQADVEAARQATERQYQIARDFEATQAAAAEQARAASLTVTDTDRTVADRPASTPQATTQQAPEESVMGFTGDTCDQARRAAQMWVGSGGTFQIKFEGRSGSECLVQIHNWKSTGKASSQ